MPVASENPAVQFVECAARQGMGDNWWTIEVAQSPFDFAARLKVMTVLSHPALRGIHFTIPGAEVSTRMLERVLAAISNYSLSVGLWQPGVPGYTKDASAQYDKDADALYVDLGTKDRLSISNVVHEAVHAAHDIGGSKTMTRLASETAAYIAECVFQLKKQKPDHRTLIYANGSAVDAIYEAAWPLALKVLGRGGNSSKVTSLTTVDVGPLEKAINGVYDPSVAQVADFNGIPDPCQSGGTN